MNIKINQLAKQIQELYMTREHKDTWQEHINVIENTLEVISESKQGNLDEKDLIILKGLIKEALNFGLSVKDPTIRSYKRNKLYELTNKVKEEVENNPYLKYEEKEITDFNSWIRSLQIFKIGEYGLEENIYRTSYDLYQGMRKVILSKSSPVYQKIYVAKIVEKLGLEENLKKLPENIEIKQADYELYQIIKLVKENPNFDYHSSDNKLGKRAYTKARDLDSKISVNRVKVLIKK